MPGCNSNKIPKKLSSITLHAQPVDRAVDLCRSILLEAVLSEDGADVTVKALYKPDHSSAVSHLLYEFPTLLNNKRERNESFKHFESRFAAQIVRYNAHGKPIALPPSIVALLLLANANMGDSKHVHTMSASSPKASTSVTYDTTNDDMITLVEYE